MVRRAREHKMACGCWNAINTHPGLDLREDDVHGLRGHRGHAGIVHAWCSECSPGSGQVIEEALARYRARADAAPDG